MGIRPLLQFPHLPRAGPVLLTLLLSLWVPSSYQVLRGSIYSFPLVRYSCLLSAGVLHALLCLKVYSWCIHGEMYSTSAYSSTILFQIDAFELWCWRKLLRVPWTARRSNQSILKETSPEYSLEGLVLKLKLQYSGHLMWRTVSLEKTLMLGRLNEGGEGDDRGWDGWMASPTQWMWVFVSSGSWWWTRKPDMLQSMGSEWDTTKRLNWTEAELTYKLKSSHQ